LEGKHDNIRVFRHPDHTPTGYDIQAELGASFSKLSLNTFDLSKVSGNAIKSLYGTQDDMVLFWAHHEKLCIVDRKIAFMGGLDMCKLQSCSTRCFLAANLISNQASEDGTPAVRIETP
jgi:phospholipase D1/2